MSSATETVMLALVAALAAKAAEEDSPLPPPERNRDLVTRMVADADGGGLQRYLNVLDGDRAAPDELLGADLGAGFYDIVWRPVIEFAVMGADDAAREAAFDAMRCAIWDCLKVASGDTVTWLGGAVSSLTVVDLLPPEASAIARAGLPDVKGSDFVIEVTYTSGRPF